MDDFYTRVARYRCAISFAKELLNEGVISKEEFDYIDTIIAKKCGLSSSTIWRE